MVKGLDLGYGGNYFTPFTRKRSSAKAREFENSLRSDLVFSLAPTVERTKMCVKK